MGSPTPPLKGIGHQGTKPHVTKNARYSPPLHQVQGNLNNRTDLHPGTGPEGICRKWCKKCKTTVENCLIPALDSVGYGGVRQRRRVPPPDIGGQIGPFIPTDSY